MGRARDWHGMGGCVQFPAPLHPTYPHGHLSALPRPPTPRPQPLLGAEPSGWDFEPPPLINGCL